MKILITGANGYIGQRLIPVLLEQGHELFCCVRNRKRFEAEHTHERIGIIEIDFLENTENQAFPNYLDVAFYLIHSMNSKGDFAKKAARTAENFIQILQKTACRQTIYLSSELHQTTTFQPRGVCGRIGLGVLPFHFFVFNGMIDRLADMGKR